MNDIKFPVYHDLYRVEDILPTREAVFAGVLLPINHAQVATSIIPSCTAE